MNLESWYWGIGADLKQEFDFYAFEIKKKIFKGICWRLLRISWTYTQKFYEEIKANTSQFILKKIRNFFFDWMWEAGASAYFKMQIWSSFFDSLSQINIF